MVFFVKKEKVDFIFAGLGNPGDEYERTKHNVGFRVVDAFATEYFPHKSFFSQLGSLIYSGEIGSSRIILVKPQNYMNLSGPSLKWLARKYPADEIVVIYDEMDLPPGRIRLANSGGSAGHRGMESIKDSFRKQEIKRIRIGIGGRGDMEGAEYVLTPFSGLDAQRVENAVNISIKAMRAIIENGFDHAMNTFNRKDISEIPSSDGDSENAGDDD
ncbi:aminoacyl-tRNA hydrolase [bacterium]|nr:aminoacyl-tRNA hydrolase [bacterium]MBU1025866.1 aminoacyl-tRNA hydrolase [bacterium]